MLIAYVAVEIDGSPALDTFTVSAARSEPDNCDEQVKAWLSERIDMDEDGGAIFCLAVTGKPGDRYEVKQDGQIVAVVVRL